MKDIQKTLVIPLMIIGVTFFVAGFGVGISGFLTPALKDALHLTTSGSYLVTAAIFSAFVIFGSPAAWVIRKIGYKKSMMIAFLIMSAGMLLFIPSAKAVSFPLFLVALFVGGIGNTLLQASVNPYVTICGPEESAAMRMSLMGIMNKLAWWIAPLFLGLFIDLQDVRLGDVSLPFFIAGLVLTVLAVFIYFAPLPEVSAVGEDEPVSESGAYGNKKSALQYPHLVLGVLALFLYVGIETLPMASAIDFANVAFSNPDNPERFSLYVTIGLIAGYLFGVLAIPKVISQSKALQLFALIGIVSSLFLILAPVNYAFYGIMLISFSNSIMWPAIWPLAISGLGPFTKQGASFLVMAIFGGAVIPIIFGLWVDALKASGTVLSSAYQTAYWLLVPCYLFILFYAFAGHKIGRKQNDGK